jgi:stage II sporulation protein D
VVRVALAVAAPAATVDADGDWLLLGPDARAVLAHARGDQPYEFRADRRGIAAVPLAGGFPASSGGGTIVVRGASPSTVLRWNGRRYRGELAVSAGPDGGVLVVNRLGIEDYLRGVVPREVGSLAPADRAAIEAQAVAARSYALARLGEATSARPYDLGATVANQVYGGADAERAASDDAVRSTAGEVLLYDGRVVDALYHSTCGGSTAAPAEVWQEQFSQPYLRRVSDRIPGTTRAYCDISPRYNWRRTFDGPALDDAVARYLRNYVAVGPTGPGRVRSARVDGHTPSGRAAALVLETDAGRYVLRGNQIRSVLRGAGGEILNSTYFTVESMNVGANGRLARLTLHGGGNGHGVGMCQWGSIGRARAGHNYREILAAYYPGTAVGYAPLADGRAPR